MQLSVRGTTSITAPKKPSMSARIRLALMIHRLALTRQQILALPDNYAEAAKSQAFPSDVAASHVFLPTDILQENGPWVCVGSRSITLPTAPRHIESCSGRSTFIVFIKLPAGRAQTLSYLQTLIPRSRDQAIMHCHSFHKEPAWSSAACC